MKEYIKDYILDRLADMKGEYISMDDLPNLIYQNDMATGSITCDRKKAQDFNHAHEHEFACAMKYLDGVCTGMGNNISKLYFDNPEKAMCYLVATYVDVVVSRFLSVYHCDFDWDCKITVDQAFIDHWTENIEFIINEVFNEMDNLA